MKYLVILLILFIQACSDGGGQDAGVALIQDQTFSGSAAGEPVSIQIVASLNKEYIDSSLTNTSSTLAGVALYGAHIYKLTYVSNDANKGSDTFNASGLLIVPYSVEDDANNSAPWVVLSHGTIVDNASAPTNNLREGLLEASLGFITLVPDYIGFGESYSSDPSTRIHPYIIGSSYASDGVNMMNAAKSVLSTMGITPGRLYLKGYSEGGYATLALQKELETNHSSTYTVTASAPSAGPYSTVGLGALLTTSLADTTISPTLFGFLATSYYYNYSAVASEYDLSAVFNQTDSYDEETLFNGQKSSTETEAVYAGLSISTINGLLSSSVVSSMGTQLGAVYLGFSNLAGDSGASFGLAATSLTDSFSSSLLTNDLLMQSYLETAPNQYFPRVTTIFYHCSDDDTIYPDGTTAAVAAYTGLEAAYGVSSSNISSVTSSTGGHGTCPYIFTPAICFAQLEAVGGSKATLDAAVAGGQVPLSYCD